MNKHKRGKTMLTKRGLNKILLLVLILTIAFSSYALATYISVGSPSPTVTLRPYSFDSPIHEAINASIIAWNFSGAGVQIQRSDSNSQNEIIAKSFSDTWYGMATQWKKTWFTPYRYRIDINTRTISRDATSYGSFIQSVVVHEFGHIFWLADNPPGTNPSIMRHNRNRNTMVTPQVLDVTNVKNKYD